MREFVFFPFEVNSEENTEPYRENEKSGGFQERHPYLRNIAAFKARHDAERDYADNVVYNRRADYRLSDFGIEFAQFFKRFHGYPHARRRENRADENGVEEFFVREFGVTFHKAQRAERAERNRNENAEKGDHRGGKSAVFKVVEVGFESAREKNKHHAHLTERIQNFFFRARRLHENRA